MASHSTLLWVHLFSICQQRTEFRAQKPILWNINRVDTTPSAILLTEAEVEQVLPDPYRLEVASSSAGAIADSSSALDPYKLSNLLSGVRVVLNFTPIPSEVPFDVIESLQVRQLVCSAAARIGPTADFRQY